MNRVLAIAVLAAPVFGGGFWLEFANPKASSDPRAKDAALIVRATGCHNPAKAIILGKAEGFVNGRRHSVPLELVALGEPGMYAVKRTWPQEGVWVLALTGTTPEGIKTGGVVPLGMQGFVRSAAKTMPHHPTAEEVDATLNGSTSAPK